MKLIPHKHADIIRALAEGQMIQYFDNYSSEWIDINPNAVVFNINYEYRVKPKPESIYPNSDYSAEFFYDLFIETTTGCTHDDLVEVINFAIDKAIESGKLFRLEDE